MKLRSLSIITIFLSVLSLSSCGDISNQATSKAEAPVSEVLTWDCETSESQPSTMMITCGDGGMYLDNIKWSTWSAEGAQGEGTYNVNDCEPDCADGNFHTAKVKIELSHLTPYKGKQYLRDLTFETEDGSALPQSDSSSYQWDVMEFAVSMDSQ